MLWQITLGILCFGLCVEDGIVMRAAPVAGWTVGSTWDYVKTYYQARGAVLVERPE